MAINRSFLSVDQPSARELRVNAAFSEFDAKFSVVRSASLQSAVRSLVVTQRSPSNRTLPDLPPRGALLTPVAVARPSGTQGGSGGGSIASPLTETDAATRTFHPPITITSTDGLFVLEIEPLKDIDLTDANNNPVRITYDAL